MFEKYENDFSFSAKLPNGAFIYRLEEDEIEAVKEAIKAGRLLPVPKSKRLIPFGEGVEVIGDRITVNYRGTFLGVFPTLKKALKAWDVAERYERFKMEKDAEQEAINERFYANVSYDDNGYKIRK